MSATPAPASTVVLVDEQYNVFLTKRPETMKFLGGFYVFPGGAMDEGDKIIDESLLNGTIAHTFLHGSYYVAAARELFEEVGILLGNNENGSSIVLTKEQIGSYRKQLLAHEMTFAQLLEREQLTLDITCLQYFGQLTTPKFSPVRFDTKFFLTTIPDGQVPVLYEYEIDDAFWVSPEEGLQMLKNKELLLAPPTIVVLESLKALKKGEKLALNNDRVEQLAKQFFG